MSRTAGASGRFILYLVCQAKVSPATGALRVECQCGMEYHALTGQPVDEPLYGLLTARRPQVREKR